MTTQQGLRLATGVVVENLGTTVLVMIPRQHDVLTLTGPAADVVGAVVAGQPVSTDLEPEVELLLSAGVLTSPVSRRSLLRAGAIGAGAGIAVLSMPSVAAASSPGGGTSSGGGDDDDPPSIALSATGDPATSFTATITGLTTPFASGTTANISIFSADPAFNSTYNNIAVVDPPSFAFTVTGLTGGFRPPGSLFSPGSGATFTVAIVGGQTFTRTV